MTIAETFLAEFEQETPTTIKFLERIPEDKLSWRPHEKSMTAGQLALHMAVVPSQVVAMAREDVAQLPNVAGDRPQPKTKQEYMDALAESVAQVKQVLSTFTDEQMQATWRLKNGDKELLAMPRAAFLRNILLNHWYHHRGQLGVYLRLLGAKVPSSYGPSADELPDFAR